MSRLWGAVALLALLCISLGSLPVAGAAKAKRPRREVTVSEGPTDEPFDESVLGSSSLTYVNLLERGKQYFHDTRSRNFQGNVLGYVTPWNNYGYEVAEKFNSKFTHISPVWYQIKGQAGNIALLGQHEVNQTWIQALRTPAREGAGVPKVVPRFISELEGNDMGLALTTSAKHLARLLTAECEQQGYDGMVLEVWMHWAMMNVIANDQYRAYAVNLLRELASQLHASLPPKELILAVPPAVPARHNMPEVGLEAFKQVLPFVDGFSVMTYDFSHEPGANSPIPWLHTNIEHLMEAGREAGVADVGSKLFMGTNFYGYKFSMRGGQVLGRDAIVAEEFMQLLQKHTPDVGWHEDMQEHFVEVKAGKKQLSVWFPTPYSLMQRLEALSQHQAGLSIWELGQGLNSFMDVL